MSLLNKIEKFIVNRLWRQNGIINLLLRPFSLIYLMIHYANFYLKKPKAFSVKIICIGNITVGGAGKTPIALALGKIAMKYFQNLVFIGHGYKASLLKRNHSILVDCNRHNAEDVGDEALLMSRLAPTYIARERATSINAACLNKVDLAILDDGFQDNSIKKNINILVIDENYKLGNQLILPAGPLRECSINAFKRANLIIVSGIESKRVNESRALLVNQFANKVPNLEFKITTSQIYPSNLQELVGRNFFAILGISQPDKFLNLAKKYGIKIKDYAIFSDHYNFTKNDLAGLYEHAKRIECDVITSSKDFVRLPLKYKNVTKILEIDIIFEDLEKIEKLLFVAR